MQWLDDDPEAAAEREKHRAGEAKRTAANGHDPDPNGKALEEIEPLSFTVASSLAGRTPPERPWLIRDWIPRRQVTLLSGDGGTGKSMLALQLQVATAARGTWLGLPVMSCPSFGLYAEDDEDEIHRRLVDIAELGKIDIANLSHMMWRSTVEDNAELVETDIKGGIHPTGYFTRVRKTALEIGAKLVVLDAVTNLYGADEIKRRQVNSFVGLLRRLAIEIDGAVLLLSHPSVQGINSGSGLSGSTHWHNAVRSRLYFTRTEGDDADPNERKLERPKANYAGSGAIIRVRWSMGAFIGIDTSSGIDRMALNAKAERVFLAILTDTYATGSWTSPNMAARNYAPTIFAKHPGREALAKSVLENAMYRLKQNGRIKTEIYGKPSDQHVRWAPA